MAARDEKLLLRLKSEFAAVRLLIVDELGCVPLLPTEAELLCSRCSASAMSDILIISQETRNLDRLFIDEKLERRVSNLNINAAIMHLTMMVCTDDHNVRRRQ
jgi:DNA replication protein DnaC